MDDEDKVLFHSFLRYYDLVRYYEGFVKMGVLKVSHLKDVSDDDLQAIGLSRPERTRLRKKAVKNFSASGKLKNKILGKDKRKFVSLGKEEAVVAAVLAARERDHQRVSPPTPPRPGSQGRKGEGLESPVLITPESIELGEILGEGAHGAVHEAEYRNVHGSVKVAVKTITTHDRGKSIEAVIQEAQSMMQLHHTHIIKFFGIVLGSPLMLVQELAPFGNLRDHVLSHHHRIHLGLMYTYACQIADAMAYLEEHKLVHRDLATRNILLLSEGHVKLSDFGLARKITEGCSIYNITNVGVLLPIAWTALEALAYGQFSSASDVWSYGVTLWEIYSLGETPLEGMRPIEVREMLQSGDRLMKPIRCPPMIYHVMQQCWLEQPETRPTFRDLHKIVKELVPEVVQMTRPHITEGNLCLTRGEIVYVIDKPAGSSGPWLGMGPDGKVGYFSGEFTRTVDPQEMHALSPVRSAPLQKPLHNKYQGTPHTSDQVSASGGESGIQPEFNKYMTVIGSPAAKGLSPRKPSIAGEETGAGAPAVDWDRDERHGRTWKDRPEVAGVDKDPSDYHQSSSSPMSPLTDDNKYVTMKKMQDLEVNFSWRDDNYIAMQPSPIHGPECLPGQSPTVLETRFGFQASVDPNELPDPIISGPEILHKLLYSPSSAGTRADVSSVDQLGLPSENYSSARRSYDPRLWPQQRAAHYAGLHGGAFDRDSGPYGLQTEPEWDPLPTQPLRRTSQENTTTTSPLSSEASYLGYPPEQTRFIQPSTSRQLLSPSPQRDSPASGSAHQDHFEALCKEFPDLSASTCWQALGKHGGNLERAREEVKVQQLMEMEFQYINEGDCRRALSHCQGKMERAAMWLMEQSATIASRT